MPNSAAGAGGTDMPGLMGMTPEERRQWYAAGMPPEDVVAPPPSAGYLAGQVPMVPPSDRVQDTLENGLPVPPIPPWYGDAETVGAPWWVRARVGAQATPADRLAELRRMQPFATPLPDDPTNYTYFDEASGKQVIYRPRGLRVPDWGDVASVIPEAVGGLLGTGAAMAAGAASKNPVAALGAYAAGDIAGQEGARWTINKLTGGKDTRSAGDMAVDAAAVGAADMVIPPAVQRFVTPYVAPLVRAMLPKASPVSDAVARLNATAATDEAKIAPNLADVLDSPGLARLSNATQQFLGGGRISREAGAAMDALTKRADDVLGTIAGAPDKVPDGSMLGQVVRDAATRANKARLDAIEAARNQVVGNMGGPAARVDMWPMVELEDRLAQRALREPEMARILQPALTEVRSLIKSGTGEMSLQNVLENRSVIGDAAFGVSEAGRSLAAKQREYVRQVYDTLNETLTGQAQQAGPDVAAAWAKYNTATAEQQGAGRLRQSLAYYANEKADPDTLRNSLIAELGGDQTRLKQLLDTMDPGDRRQVLAGMFRHMGQPSIGEARVAQAAAAPAGFSAGSFASKWAMVPPAARETLLSYMAPAERQAVEDLATVASGMRLTRDIAGKSPTAGAEWLRTMVAGGAASFAGSPLSSGELIGPAAVVPAAWMAARALTSPWMRDFMMRTPRAVSQQPTSLLGTAAGRGASAAEQSLMRY